MTFTMLDRLYRLKQHLRIPVMALYVVVVTAVAFPAWYWLGWLLVHGWLGGLGVISRMVG